MTTLYLCGQCQGPVSKLDTVCSHCSAAFTRIRCPACKYVGHVKDFYWDRCPQCGARRLLLE